METEQTNDASALFVWRKFISDYVQNNRQLPLLARAGRKPIELSRRRADEPI